MSRSYAIASRKLYITASKTAPLSAGACSFNCGVQRENLGLESNAFNDTCDLGNLAGAAADLTDGPNHSLNRVVTGIRHTGCTGGESARLAGIVSILPYRLGQLGHACRGFLERRGLFFSASR